MKDSLLIDRGTEGPKNDPYGYTEYDYSNGEKTITAHVGLLTWISIDGKRFDTNYKNVEMIFRRETGFTFDEFEAEWEKREYTCSNCGAFNEIEWVEGHPGETIGMCIKCGSGVASEINMGAII